MKTELAVPTAISRAAKQLARQMGMTLEEFFTVAITTYVVAHQKKLITDSLNQIYARESSALDPVIAKLQRLTLGDEEW